MKKHQFKSGAAHVALALRDPEAFAVRWNVGDALYPWWVWFALLMTAVIGTTTYGMTMGINGGVSQVLLKGLICTLSAGLAWAIALPALYILNSLSGSRLPASSTLLAALVTVSWGGLAMVASIPVNWFFSAAVPHPGFVLAVNLTIFAAVGVAMVDVFGRVMRNLEPKRREWPLWWLVLVAAIGSELFYAFGLFQFAATR